MQIILIIFKNNLVMSEKSCNFVLSNWHGKAITFLKNYLERENGKAKSSKN